MFCDPIVSSKQTYNDFAESQLLLFRRMCTLKIGSLLWKYIYSLLFVWWRYRQKRRLLIICKNVKTTVNDCIFVTLSGNGKESADSVVNTANLRSLHCGVPDHTKYMFHRQVDQEKEKLCYHLCYFILITAKC